MSKQEKKLTFEEEINLNLSEDLQKNALDFAEYMNNSSTLNYLDELVCCVCVDPSALYIYFGSNNNSVCYSDHENLPIDKELKEFLWAHVNQCNHFKTNGAIC